MEVIANFFQQEWVKDLITLGSIIAAIFAWVAKIRWSKEYSYAKDAVISSKEAQIELVERENRSLREQTPEKLLERYKTIQKHLEDTLEKMGNELQAKEDLLDSTSKNEESLKDEIEKRENQIKKLRRELGEAQLAQASAKRLSLLSLDLGESAFQYRMDKYNSDMMDEYIDNEDRYTHLPDEPTIKNMVEWFLENYKDPVDGVPWNDGEYYYVYGGPYHADEELWDHFPDANEDDIEKAVEEIESDGTIDWVKQWQY